MPRRPGADAKLRARHAADAPRRFRKLYEEIAAFPSFEHPLIGQRAILRHLHERLALRRPNGGPLTWRMILRWARSHDFPLLSGILTPYHHSPALSSTAALTAWTLTRFSTADRNLFRVYLPPRPEDEGKRPRARQRESGVGKGRWTRPLATIDLDALLDTEPGAVAAAPR